MQQIKGLNSEWQVTKFEWKPVANEMWVGKAFYLDNKKRDKYMYYIVSLLFKHFAAFDTCGKQDPR